jgi:hypothetical protein
MRGELKDALQEAIERYPAGYEDLINIYFKAISEKGGGR